MQFLTGVVSGHDGALCPCVGSPKTRRDASETPRDHRFAAPRSSRDLSAHDRERRLEEILADSTIKTVMEADDVDSRELEAELRAPRRVQWRRGLPADSSGIRTVLRGKRGDHMRYRIVVWSAIAWIAVCLVPYLYALNDLITWR